ncbi:hypothetical protein HY988_06370 [Candidatus Micrarchaeota archaeon]|nr:hypothetical protein [Candidatus Micrarchaeota archaeon]
MRLDFIDFNFSETRKVGPNLHQGVATNIDVNNVKMEENMLSMDFVFTAIYSPSNSNITIGGSVKFSGDEIKAAYSDYTKNKKFSPTYGEEIVNAINYHASMNAILIGRAVNLPPPVILPTIKFQNNQVPAKSKK